jgi:hypothetical protein
MWLFGDSFDHYSDLYVKYQSVPLLNPGVIEVGQGRFGTNCYKPANAVLRPLVPGSPTSGAFLSMAIRFEPTIGSGGAGFCELWHGHADGLGHVVCRYNAFDATISVLRCTLPSGPLQTNYGTFELGTTPVGLILPKVWTHFECYVKVHATAGVVRVRINGAEVVTLTGVNTFNPYYGGTEVSAWNEWAIGSESSSAGRRIDDVMQYDDFDNGDGVTDFLGDLTGEAIVASGVGASSQWTRNSGATNVSCVDENPADGDTTYVEDGTVGHVDTYTVAPLTRIVDGIKAVQVMTTARKSGTGTRAIATILRSGGTNYFGPTNYLGSDYGMTIAAFPKDPATGGDWSSMAVGGAEIGQQVKV